MADFEPKQFGKYLLLDKLAVGGMAEIYKAKTYGVDGFEKQLVIKRILPHCSADKDFVAMLIDEAKLSVMLSHANIVQVYDLGKVGDDYYISMEFIHGVNLRDMMYRCREGGIPISTDIAVYIISEICKGLDYAHRKTDQNNHALGIVHRDISPQNILLSYEGEVKIVDFGIAKAAMNISHTMAGILKGKIAYMSPEQAMGKAVDRRTDLFSTGILLYEMLTGTKLYTGESQFEVLKKIRTTRITAEKLPASIPEELKPIVVKALAFNPDDRFEHAGDLQIELTKYLYSKHIDFSPRKLAVFIKEIFADIIRGEQAVRAHEAAVEGLTSSVAMREKEKQLYIVHRDEEGQPEDTSATEGAKRKQHETLVSAPPQQPQGGMSARSLTKKEIEKPKKKMRLLFKAASIFLILAASAYLALRYVPSLHFWEKKTPSAGEKTFGSLNITSDPEGAKIIIDGKDTGSITPSTIEHLEAGKYYKVKAEKDDYGPSEKSVQITGAEQIDVTLTLTLPVGTLNIITDPPGASIMLDDRLTGLSTPATLENLKLNTDFKISISKPDYQDFEQVINLTSSKPQKIATKLVSVLPQQGKLVVNSTPAGAKLILDGLDTGRTTPVSIDNLDPKKYAVTLKMEDYDEWSRSIDVVAGQALPLNVELVRSAVTTPVLPPTPETPPSTPTTPTPPVEAKAATLKISSTPPGALISLDGAATGKKTPATIENLKVGGTYKIRVDLDGYKGASRKATLAKESNAIALNLAKEGEEPPAAQPPAETTPTPAPTPPAQNNAPGSIKITSNPSGADVNVNSEYKGKTPLTVSAPAGTAQVTVSLEGRSRVSRTVTVRPGETVNLTNIELGDVFGEVMLSSDPPSAQVIFDGSPLPARTPVTIRKVRRDRTHVVQMQMSGYRTWSTSFNLEEDSKSIHATLQPQ